MSLLVLGALVVAIGFMALVSAVQTSEVCTGDVVDTVLCEGAQLRQSIFGGLIGAAMIIAAAILAAAWLIAGQTPGSRDAHDAGAS